MNRASRQASIALLSDVDPTTITVKDVIDGVALITATTSDGTKAMALMPALRPRTPVRIARIWMDRVEANLTGRCPRCQAVIGTTAGDAADLAHGVGCPVSHSELLEKHVDQNGLRLVAALAGGRK